MRTRTGAILLLLLVASGCGDDTAGPAVHEPVTVAKTSTPAATASRAPRSAKPSPRRQVEPPCDAGGGNPRPRAGCPDAHPDTGWLRVHAGGAPALRQFRTVLDDDEGRAYARAHHFDTQFFDGFADVPTGDRRSLVLAATTVCTGITIDPGADLADHVVPCTDLVATARRYSLPVAVWTAHGVVVQASELYRP